MDQTLINYLMAGFGAAISFILRVIWEGLRELQKADVELTSRFTQLQLLVAGDYVKREDLKEALKEMAVPLFAKLDKIENKLDTKADRHV